MSWSRRVVWSEGMFLRPQHMQQADRWTESLMDRSLQAAGPYLWGLTDLVIDRAALEEGKLILSRAAGFFPDGTDFDTADDAGTTEPLPLPFEPAPGLRDALVFLACPVRRANALEFAEVDDRASTARFIGSLVDTGDVTASSDASERPPIEVARLNLTLKTSEDDLQGWNTIPIARLVEQEADGKLVLDEAFIPTMMKAKASPTLVSYIEEVAGMVDQRAEALSSQLGAPGAGGASEVRDFLLLQLLNGAGAELAHIRALDTLHPERLYTHMVTLAGELATYAGSNKADGQSFKRADLEGYRHGDLTATFEEVVAVIRQSLARKQMGRVLPIALNHQGNNLFTGEITDRSVLGNANFVLVASSAAPREKMIEHLPQLMKVSAVETINDKVYNAVPAAPLTPLQVIPRQLPPDTEAAYFEIDTASPAWAELAQSAGVAVHVSKAPKDLVLKIYAIRSNA